MKRLLIVCSMLLTTISYRVHAQGLSENFDGNGLPAGWILVNKDMKTASFHSSVDTALTRRAWIQVSLRAGGKAMLTTSRFTPAGTADRWLITPLIPASAITSNTVLKWDDNNLGSAEKIQILVSPTGDTATAAFTAMIYNQQAGFNNQNTHALSLRSYAGRSIRIAFRDNNTDEGAMLLDNVSVQTLPGIDAAMATVTPATNSPDSYSLANSRITIAGTVKNNGIDSIRSYTVKYQQGNNPVVSQAFTAPAPIPVLGTADFRFTTPYTIPAVGTYPVKVWVEVAGDNIRTNDSMSTIITGVPFMPVKKLVFEEATGTWCVACPRGIVFMDSVHKITQNVSLVAVHNRDPMEDNAYNNFVTGFPGFSGFPSVIIDRRKIMDPGELIDVYNQEKNSFGFAEVSVGTAQLSGNTLTLSASIKPSVALSGDYRLVLVITEDRVHDANNSGYDQANAYSGGQAGPMANAEYNFVALPDPVPASSMYYDFVARAIVPSPQGTTNLPSSMAANSSYNYTFTATLQPSWVKNKLKSTVMLIRGSDGHVLNSGHAQLPLGINSPDNQSLNGVVIYPNPSTRNTTLKFEVKELTTIGVSVTDAMGRTVHTVPDAKMNVGIHELQLQVGNLATGIYNVKIQTSTGFVSKRLTIAH